MTREILNWLLATVFLVTASFAQAQQRASLLKIGWLGSGSAPGQGGGFSGVWPMLRELGYVEGKNIAVEYRFADNRLDRLPALADELVRLKVDLIVAVTTNDALAAKKATSTIPIVFLNVSDPVAVGLIDSLARPGGNITGITNIAAVLSDKRLELLKETVAKLSRVAVLWNPQNTASAQVWKESQQPARELGLQLYSMEVSSADKLESAFKEAIKARSAALAVTQNPLIASTQKQIRALAIKNRLPTIYHRGDFVESGGLMSYGADPSEPFKRAAAMVEKILKGTKPADIPAERPMRFEFIVNLKTAKQIGVTIPPNVLVRAQKVIK